MAQDKPVTLAAIVGAHGVTGEVRVKLFGEGEIDFTEVLAGLREVGYAGGVHVELSRHSHNAVETAARAQRFLQAGLSELSRGGSAGQ